MFPPFRPPNAPNVPRATRLRRYTALLAELLAATSIAEDDDAAVQKELEDMKFWIANEFVWTAGGIGGLTYDDSPRDVQQLVVDCVETTSHVLRLWANRPCVLQGSSAAAKELTSVLLLYVGMTWQGPSISEARQQVASPGFLIAYTSTCDALAAALDKASAADVPQHLGEFTAMLLWTWGGILKMYEESSSGFLDPVLQPMLLPSARLAGAALRCWAGPAAAGLERTVPLSKAVHAATDVSVMLVKGAQEISAHLRETRIKSLRDSVAASHEVQWLLCCYAALAAQALHRQLRGRQPASLPATNTTTIQQQRQQSGQQQQQQERAKVAPMHKRLLEGLQVPGLIGWESEGMLNREVWNEPEAFSVASACAVFSNLHAYGMGSSSSSSGSSSRDGRELPLLTATVHLRRAAVLLELCLLFPERHVLCMCLQDITREVQCMFFRLREEVGGVAATWDRVQAAVASGILPTLLQQLLPVLARVLQAASEEPVAVSDACSRAAAEVGMLLANVVPGPHCPLQQLLNVLQQPSSVSALEACIRCWTQLHTTLPQPHIELLHIQQLTTALAGTLAAAVTTQPTAVGAGAATIAEDAAWLFASQDVFALFATGLKAGVFAAGKAIEDLRGTAGDASQSTSSRSSSSSSIACRRIVLLLLQATMTADIAMAASSSLASSSSNRSSSSNSSSSSSSSSRDLRAAWQLLLAHSLHAVGSKLLAVHAVDLPPVEPQLQDQQHGYQAVLQGVAAAVAWARPQLNALQQQAAAAVAAAATTGTGLQRSEQKQDRLLALLQQQESLSDSFAQLLTAAASSSSELKVYAAEFRAPLADVAQDQAALQWLLSLKGAVPAELAQQLTNFGAALSGRFPARLCCNAPGCSSMARFSELEAVGGKACMCSGCKTARYCCRACQESHWKAHKAACRALAAARQ